MNTPGYREPWDIAIRADGNSFLGMGHIVRCLSIALALRELGLTVGFMCADQQAVDHISAKGFDVVVFETSFDDLVNAEAELKVLSERKAKLVIVDSRYATPGYFDRLGQSVLTCQITPSLETAAHTDILINYSGYLGEQYYSQVDITDKMCLFGMSYAPFGIDYWKGSRRPISEKVERILITVGSTDPLSVVPRVLEVIDATGKYAHAIKDVVVGRFAKLPDSLLAEWDNRSDVNLHIAPNSLLELEQVCDLAVCAAGTTIYELLAFGVPVICCAIVDDQLRVSELDGVVSWCGDIRGDEPGRVNAGTMARLSAALERLFDYPERKELAEVSASMIDFSGARRIAERLHSQIFQLAKENEGE